MISAEVAPRRKACSAGDRAAATLGQTRTGRPQTELTPRYAWRLLQLIDRVLNHAREAQQQEPVEAAAGDQAVIEAAARPADWIMAAIVGAAGLRSAWAAAATGATLALANKESLVCCGPALIGANLCPESPL